MSKEYKKSNKFKKEHRLRKVSIKRAKQLREYKKIRETYLRLNPNCEICKRAATEIHHKSGRNGERLNDISKFMAICRTCHTWVHNNPQQSRNKNWII